MSYDHQHIDMIPPAEALLGVDQKLCEKGKLSTLSKSLQYYTSTNKETLYPKGSIKEKQGKSMIKSGTLATSDL